MIPTENDSELLKEDNLYQFALFDALALQLHITNNIDNFMLFAMLYRKMYNEKHRQPTGKELIKCCCVCFEVDIIKSN